MELPTNMFEMQGCISKYLDKGPKFEDQVDGWFGVHSEFPHGNATYKYSLYGDRLEVGCGLQEGTVLGMVMSHATHFRLDGFNDLVDWMARALQSVSDGGVIFRSRLVDTDWGARSKFWIGFAADGMVRVETKVNCGSVFNARGICVVKFPYTFHCIGHAFRCMPRKIAPPTFGGNGSKKRAWTMLACEEMHRQKMVAFGMIENRWLKTDAVDAVLRLYHAMHVEERKRQQSNALQILDGTARDTCEAWRSKSPVPGCPSC